MNITKRAMAAVLLSSLGFAVSAHAGRLIFEHGPNLVVNGDFETGNFSSWTQWGNPGFTGVDCLDGCFGGFAAFAGPFGSTGGIQQDLVTTVGASYNIHLFLQSDGSSPNQFFVDWGVGNTVYSIVNDGAHGYTEIIIDPLATSATTTLRIGFQNDFGFFNLDDVSVRQVSEPRSLALFGLGWGALGLSRRRKPA